MVLNLAIKYTLDEVFKTRFGLYGSLENNTLLTVFSIVIYQNYKMRNAFIVWLKLKTILSQTLFSTIYQVIPTAKCYSKYKLTRYWHLL